MNWEKNTLSNLCFKVTDGTHDSPKSVSSGFPFIKGTHVKKGRIDFDNCEYLNEDDHLKVISRSKPEKGDTLFANIGANLGECAHVNVDFEFSIKNVALFKPDDKYLNGRFLYFLLSSNFIQTDIISRKSGSAQPFLSLNALRSYKIIYPALETQKRIADILSDYDDLIENNLKRIKLLEQAAQNIYKEWFVNLRFPGHENTPINEETGLPEGWGNAELGSVATVQSSKRVFLADYVDIGVPFYRGKEISQKVKHEVISEPYFISHEKFREFDSRFGSPKENDILITAVGTIGNCYLARKSDLPFYFKDGNLLWIHSYNENVSGFYLIQYFQSPIFKEILNSITIGSSQKALTITAVKKLNITVPNNEMLEKFDSIIKPTMNQIEVLAKQNQKLKAARDILLPRLMNRTIEV
ncbi:restriction endonuclease subunit S [Flavobacteriaceae bacterium]|nr:restriction endonuclease subunit S [Flavobacteriaceae bacterium]